MRSPVARSYDQIRLRREMYLDLRQHLFLVSHTYPREAVDIHTLQLAWERRFLLSLRTRHMPTATHDEQLACERKPSSPRIDLPSSLIHRTGHTYLTHPLTRPP